MGVEITLKALKEETTHVALHVTYMFSGYLMGALGFCDPAQKSQTLIPVTVQEVPRLSPSYQLLNYASTQVTV